MRLVQVEETGLICLDLVDVFEEALNYNDSIEYTKKIVEEAVNSVLGERITLETLFEKALVSYDGPIVVRTKVRDGGGGLLMKLDLIGLVMNVLNDENLKEYVFRRERVKVFDEILEDLTSGKIAVVPPYWEFDYGFK